MASAFSAAILAGGKSSRFGDDKALYTFAGKPLIEWVALTLQSVFDDVIVCGGNTTAIETLGLKCYPDAVPDRGVLAGLESALTYSHSPLVFVCACDMPLINPEVIRVVLGNVGAEPVTMPVVGDTRHPLHAVYNKSILPIIDELLPQQGTHLPDLLARVSVRTLSDERFEHIPHFVRSFINLNDRDTARELLQLLTGSRRLS